MLHNQVLEGKQVILRPLTEEDVALLARWFSDPEVVYWLQLSEDPPQLRTIEAVQERYQQMQADPFIGPACNQIRERIERLGVLRNRFHHGRNELRSPLIQQIRADKKRLPFPHLS